MSTRTIFYDTETTGTRPDKDRIIEIAAFDATNNQTFEMLVNPGCLIPAEATAIHHITDDMVKDALPFSEVGRKFIEFCSGDVVLIAHNNDAFDQIFLKNEFERNKLTMPTWRFIDSLKWSRKYRSDLPRHSLQFLRETYRIPANNAHRALDDVIVLHQVFQFMTDDLSINEIFNLLHVQRKLLHMPFGKHQGKPLKDVPPDYIKWLKSSGAFDKPENLELKTALEQLALVS